MLFALPWILWVARRPDRRHELLALAAGMSRSSCAPGLGWWLFLRELQGPLFVVPYRMTAIASSRRQSALVPYCTS